jgi:16S rRNA (guanine(1405)-N(7))-methyltransferase
MAGLINQFFTHLGQAGSATVTDLIAGAPTQPVELALLLKTLPCLEQLDKGIAPRLLAQINAPHLLISYPAHSLGGKSKGMVANYEAQFGELCAGQPWSIRRFEFPSELVFLVSR